MTIKGLYTRVQALNTDKVIDKAFDDTLTDLADINRERMNDGVRSDGSQMPNYSPVSVKVFGYPPGPIKLKATGDFQAAIFAKRDGNILHQDSTDGKTGMLVKRYGPEIFGTGGSYKKQYQDDNLRPAINKGITAATGLKFGK